MDNNSYSMIKLLRTAQFEKDLMKSIKRGCDIDKLHDIIIKLVHQEKLPPKNRDHKLQGNFKNRRECHIEPDWLLIYKVESDTLTLERTGTHSDLF